MTGLEQPVVRARGGEDVGDQFGREGSEEDPVAEVARRPDQPLNDARADRGKVVRGARAQPHA